MKKLLSFIFLLSFSHGAEARLSSLALFLVGTVRRGMATDAKNHACAEAVRVFMRLKGSPNKNFLTSDLVVTFDLSKKRKNFYFEVKPGQEVIVHPSKPLTLHDANKATKEVGPRSPFRLTHPKDAQEPLELFLALAD